MRKPVGILFIRKRSIATFFLALLSPLGTTMGYAHQTATPAAFESDPSVPVVLDVDLRTLPAPAKWHPGNPIDVAPGHVFGDAPGGVVQGWTDSARQLAGPSSLGAHLFSFSAHPDGNSNPPDTVGSIGPNHYISMVNASQFAVWDKQGNNLARARFNHLFTTQPCDGSTVDPDVQYDHAADRWLMSTFSTDENVLCVAISRGSDPVTSGWFVYDFAAPNFPDYPQYGVWNDAYYVSTMEIPSLGIYAFDRAKMLAGQPATFQRFAIQELSGSEAPKHEEFATRIVPSDAEGPTPPPAGSPGIFLRTVHASQDSINPNTRIELWEYAVDFGNSGNSSFTLAQSLTPAPYALLACVPNSHNCIAQPGTNVKLEGLGNAVMPDLKYRNFGTHESMVVNQLVDAGEGVGGIRWYELRRTPSGSGVSPWSIHQEGTYSPDNENRWMGSIAMNGNGDIALGYSVSSSKTAPEIRATARRAGDPLGEMTMQEMTLVPGDGKLTNTQRWGDYSAMDVDPADDATFWYINQVVDNVPFRPNERNVWVSVFQPSGVQVRSPDGNLSGSYYDPARPGEGLFIEIGQVGERRILFVSWYTYFQGSQRWIIGNVDFAPGATDVTVPLSVTAGTGFGVNFNPANVQFTEWGSATFRFLSCTELGFDWRSNDGETGSYSYVRLVDGLLGVSCQ